MSVCINCKKSSNLISKSIGVCGDCIRDNFHKVEQHLNMVHASVRKEFQLPECIPTDKEAVRCRICVNECGIGLEATGYCGLRKNVNGKLVHLGGTISNGILDWYHDRLPTNCVGDWVCPGGTGAGYPEYAYSNGPEYGYKNLAVFYRACSFDCLFCQNWHFRDSSSRKKTISAEQLAAQVDQRTSCICYFGGDPTPQLPHAIKVSQIALKNKKKPILRICWETNGTMRRSLLNKMAELSLSSGGCIKFDIKAWHEPVNIALCGVSNKRTLDNFAWLTKFIPQRRVPPFLIASTLLIPGYVDVEEVRKIAEFIAALDKDIPYSLLAFYPHFVMHDLPTTSRDHAYRALETAKSVGLKNIRIGNIHLLSQEY